MGSQFDAEKAKLLFDSSPKDYVSHASLLDAQSSVESSLRNVAGRTWTVPSNENSASELLEDATRLLRECEGLARSYTAELRSSFPKSTIRTVNRLTTSLRAVDDQLVKLQDEDGQSRSYIPPPLFAIRNSSDTGDDGSILNTSQRFKLKEAMQELRYLERIVKPDMPICISSYRDNILKLRKCRVILEGVKEEGKRSEKVMSSVNFSVLRCYLNVSSSSSEDLLKTEQSFWNTLHKKETAERGKSSAILTTSVMGLVIGCSGMMEQERYLMEIFTQTRESIENLKFLDVRGAEGIIIQDIISTYRVLDKLVEPLTELVKCHEWARQLVSRMTGIADANSDAIMQFKDEMSELLNTMKEQQCLINKSALRKARELLDSIQFCSHLLSATFMLSSPPVKARSGGYGHEAKETARAVHDRMREFADTTTIAVTMRSQAVV